MAQHIHHTPSAAQRIKALSHTGSLRAQNSREVIERLAATVHDISHSVDSLAAESQSTQQAADMIGAIVVQAEAEHVVSTQPALDGTSQAINEIREMGTYGRCFTSANASRRGYLSTDHHYCVCLRSERRAGETLGTNLRGYANHRPSPKCAD